MSGDIARFLRARLAGTFRSPRNAAVDETLALMDEIERTSRQAVTFCQDCGSRRILTRLPSGSTGYFSGHPDYRAEAKP